MPDETCPHCKKELPKEFLRDAPKDEKLTCSLCERSILIDRGGKIIPLSESYGDTVVFNMKPKEEDRWLN